MGLVPVPTGDPKPVEIVEPDAPEAAKVSKMAEGPEKEAAKRKWSTGAKVAGATAGGAVLGEHIAEDGWDATIAELGDVATSAGDHIADAAVDVGDFAADAAESAGDFIMDLF